MKFALFVLFVSVASAQVNPWSSWGYPEPIAPKYQPLSAPQLAAPQLSSQFYWDSAKAWNQVAPYKTAGWPSVYSVPSAEVKARSWFPRSSEWKVEPTQWTDSAVVPASAWSSAGYYSAGVPAPVEKQVVPKKVAAPVKVDQVQPVADPTPKLISYSSEISHDVPARKEEVSVASAPAVPVAPQVAPVPKVVSSPLQYSAWSGEAKPVADVKPASWATEVKPAEWTSGVKPASWASEVKPASWASEVKAAEWTQGVKPLSWTSEVKPATWSWTEPKPASWSYAPEVKPAAWSSWSEEKPWSSYVAPIQPAFFGRLYSAQPVVSTNAHHAISAPWSSSWSTGHPVAIQKRSERKPF